MGKTDKDSASYPIPAADPANPHTAQIIIRKSRFLAHACHCATPEEARGFINQIRRAQPQATHNCWAFAAGPPGDSAPCGFSDDGEPHGTAGRPMLAALLGGGVGEICMVVSRWFGGVKLGTGGLARAYQEAARQNLATLPLVTRRQMEKWRLEIGYQHISGMRRLLPGLECSLISESYEKGPVFLLSAPAAQSAGLIKALADLTSGSARLERVC